MGGPLARQGGSGTPLGVPAPTGGRALPEMAAEAAAPTSPLLREGSADAPLRSEGAHEVGG